MILRHCFLCMFSILFSFTTTSQKNILSEYKEIKDTAELSSLVKKAREYQFSQPDSFILYLETVHYHAKLFNSVKHLYLTFFFQGSYHLGKGEYQLALDKLYESLKHAENLGNNRYISYNHLAISSAYLFLAYYSLAKKHLIIALKQFEDQGDYAGIAGVYLNLTFINVEQEDFESANKNGHLAYENYDIAKNNLGIARALMNLGEVNLKLQNNKESIKYSKKALLYTKLSNQPSINGIIFNNIANAYLELNQLDSSFLYFNKSIEATKKWKNSFSFAECMQGMSKAFAKQGNTTEAITHAAKSFQIADSTNLVEVKADAAKLLSIYYSKLGKYKKALAYKNISSSINDSLFTEKKYKVQNEIEAMYQNQKKEQQIATLSKEKELEVLKNQQSKYYILSLLVLLMVVAIAAVLFNRNNKLKSSKKTIELEQRLLRSQMNPHFIFNAASSIQEFILNKNPLEASSYLSNFAKLMRSILNNSATEFILLNEEIETLEHYLKLQKLRFADKLEYEIIVDEKLETNELAIPPMLGQPFIENAIKHGIAKKTDETGKLSVKFYEKNDNLVLEIKDNGVGLDASTNFENENHQSMATKITQSRINNFKKAYKKRVDFSLNNRIDDKNRVIGVKAAFTLPKKYLT